MELTKQELSLLVNTSVVSMETGIFHMSILAQMCNDNELNEYAEALNHYCESYKKAQKTIKRAHKKLSKTIK